MKTYLTIALLAVVATGAAAQQLASLPPSGSPTSGGVTVLPKNATLQVLPAPRQPEASWGWRTDPTYVVKPNKDTLGPSPDAMTWITVKGEPRYVPRFHAVALLRREIAELEREQRQAAAR